MTQSTALYDFHKESHVMQHASFNTMPCPIARGLDRVGEWWSILILRDAFHGQTRFDQFQKSLGIAPNILSRGCAAWSKPGCWRRSATANVRPATNMC